MEDGIEEQRRCSWRSLPCLQSEKQRLFTPAGLPGDARGRFDSQPKTTRFLPWRLAEYNALSARSNAPSSESPTPNIVTPIETVTFTGRYLQQGFRVHRLIANLDMLDPDRISRVRKMDPVVVDSAETPLPPPPEVPEGW